MVQRIGLLDQATLVIKAAALDDVLQRVGDAGQVAAGVVGQVGDALHSVDECGGLVGADAPGLAAAELNQYVAHHLKFGNGFVIQIAMTRGRELGASHRVDVRIGLIWNLSVLFFAVSEGAIFSGTAPRLDQP